MPYWKAAQRYCFNLPGETVAFTFYTSPNYANGGAVTATFYVYAAPTFKPPSFTSLTATPNVLWPPNNKMVPVLVTAMSIGIPVPTCQISSVIGNEATNSPGETEWVITGPLALNLLAQRAGSGNGRVYTITVTCTNSVGNVSQAVTVTVPHDQGKHAGGPVILDQASFVTDRAWASVRSPVDRL